MEFLLPPLPTLRHCNQLPRKIMECSKSGIEIHLITQKQMRINNSKEEQKISAVLEKIAMAEVFAMLRMAVVIKAQNNEKIQILSAGRMFEAQILQIQLDYLKKQICSEAVLRIFSKQTLFQCQKRSGQRYGKRLLDSTEQKRIFEWKLWIGFCNIIIKQISQLQMIKQEEVECESLESNQSMEFEYLTNKTYAELLESHQLAKNFIRELGELNNTHICPSLQGYLKDSKFCSGNCDSVLELMESRLNKMMKNNKVKKNWSEDDLHILVWLLSKYLDKKRIESHEMMTKEDWKQVAAMIPGSNARSCMFKFVSLKKFKLAQHKWQKQQQNILFRIIDQIGTKDWKIISERLYQELPRKRIYRTAKQCREHWSCYLDPQIKKGPWEKDEDKKLLKIVLKNNCLKKWSVIKKHFEGRTQNALKNRYNLLLLKQKQITPKQSEPGLIVQSLKEVQERTEKKTEDNKQADKSVPTSPTTLIPLIPEEKRNQTIRFTPNYYVLYSANGQPSSFQNIPMNTWFFQL